MPRQKYNFVPWTKISDDMNKSQTTKIFKTQPDESTYLAIYCQSRERSCSIYIFLSIYVSMGLFLSVCFYVVRGILSDTA